MKGTTGKELNKQWNVGAQHALYRRDGKWYHHLKKFPGALFDQYGYLLFQSEHEYINNSCLQHGKELHVPCGISKTPGYTRI